jgi:antitoxin component of RelBE/YafQ-DinJ toxin-antitoxin module
MKVVMTISVTKELKEAFAKLAKELETNPTNLANMLMRRAISSRSIEFSRPQVLDFEIEPLNVSDWGDDFLQRTDKVTKRLETYFNKQKNEGSSNTKI